MKTPEKLQPFNIEIEQALLGALLIDTRNIDIAAADVESRHFYDPLHQRLFDVIVHLQGEGDVSPIVVAQVMRSDPARGDMDVPAYVRTLPITCPALPNVREFCKILKDFAFRRELISIGVTLTDAASEERTDLPVQQIADQATEMLLQAGRDAAKPVLTPFEIAMESIRESEAVKANRPVPSVKTGIRRLDKETGGLRGGDFITILGKSGMGKSALMCTIALNAAMAAYPVIFFSLEMSRTQIIERMVCDLDFYLHPEKPLYYSKVRNHQLTDEEFERFILVSRQLEGLPLEIIDEDGLNMAQIQARARAFAAKHGKNPDGTPKIGLVVADYLQIIEPADFQENRERQVARIARGCKSLAKKLNWPVAAGSQMNENDAARVKEERRPRASDARESKGIMNESDLMLAPWRQAVAVKNRKPMEARPGDPEYNAWQAEMASVRHRFDLLFLKNRHGREVDLDLWCNMGANAIRDEEPAQRGSVAEAHRDLLDSIEGGL